MPAVYSDDWYEELKQMIHGSDEFAAKAPAGRMVMTLEIDGDGKSPYVSSDGALYYMLVLDEGKVTELHALEDKHDGTGLSFRFTAPATVWEEIAAGLLDPITAGLRGKIRVRGDMRFLMQNADAVKILVDLYAAQVETDWPLGRPPYQS
jgi:hypothetical protein